MDIILAVTIAWISALAGTGVAYSLLEKRLNIQEQRHRARTRQEIEEVERTYNQRMQNRIDSLKSQYETQIQQLKISLGGQGTDSTIASEGAATLDVGTSPEVLMQSPELQNPEIQSLETIAIADQPEVSLEEGEQSHESLTTQDSVPSMDTLEISAVDPEESIEAETLIPGSQEALDQHSLSADSPDSSESTGLAESADISEPTETISTETIASFAPGADSSVVDNDRPQDSPAIVSSLYAFSVKDLATLSHPSSIETRIILAEQILEILTAQQPLEIPSRPLIHALIALSRDTEPRLRELAMRSLAQIRSPLTLPTLRRGLRDADSRVIKAAHQALEPWRAKAKVTPKITKALRSGQRLVKAKR